MENCTKVTPLNERPTAFFSTKREFFFTIQKLTFANNSPCCFEDVLVRLYITGGSGHIRINGVDFLLSPGTTCILQSQHIFELMPDEGNSLELMVLVTNYTTLNYMSISDVQESLAELCVQNPVLPLTGTQHREYEALWTRFDAECHISDVPSATIKIAILGQMQYYENQFILKSAAQYTPPIGWRMLAFITKYFSRKLSAETLAQHFDISIAVVNRELRRISTYGFDELLSLVRVNSVCALLFWKGLSIQYIAYYYGFSSEKALYSAFYKWKQMTPQEYRDSFPTYVYGYNTQGICDAPWAIINYICENYLQPITSKTAAQSLYISEGQINQCLQQYVGATFREYLFAHRIRYAKALLSISTLPICDIAVESGFSAVNTFCRVFKSVTGVTAQKYRAEHGGNTL